MNEIELAFKSAFRFTECGKCCATCLHYTSCGGGGGKCHTPMPGCTINVEGHNFCNGWKTKNM